MRVAIIGYRGFIGKNPCCFFEGKGIDVYMVTSFEAGGTHPQTVVLSEE